MSPYSLVFAALMGCGPKTPPESAVLSGSFNAEATWEEFEALVRENYADLDGQSFSVDAQLAHTRALALAAEDVADLRSILHRSTFAFSDPQFTVGPFSDSDSNLFPIDSDLVIEERETGFFVVDVRAHSAMEHIAVRPGWQVNTVGGQDMEAAIEAVWGGAVEARTSEQRAYAATLALSGIRGNTRTMTFEFEGLERIIEAHNPRDFSEEVRALPMLLSGSMEGYGWIRIHNSLGEPTIPAAFDAALTELSDSPGILIDLRNTPSIGSPDVAHAIIGHFITQAYAYPIYERPTGEGAIEERVAPRAPHYSGKVAVLGGYWTGSTGEGLLRGLHAAAGARTFGPARGDLLGRVLTFDLETADIRVELGAERLFHVNGTPREDFVTDVPMAASDRAETGEDPALRAALDWLAEP